MSLEATKDPAAMVEDADRLIERLFGELGMFDNERITHHTRLLGRCRDAGERGDADRALEMGRALDRDYVEWHLARVPYLRELRRLVETRSEFLARDWP